MNEEDIQYNLNKLDGRGSDEEYEPVERLKEMGLEFPKLLHAKYKSSKKWGERASCVYHASKYALASPEAFELAIEALNYSSKKVRHQACLLLAIAQKSDALSPLEGLLSNPDSAEDARAAMDAIERNNHNYFADRDHSGMVTLTSAGKWTSALRTPAYAEGVNIRKPRTVILRRFTAL